MSFFKKLGRFSDKNWYAPLIALFAGLDAFLFIIPIETLLLPSVILKPKRWWTSAIWVALGSAVGATFLAHVVSVHGEGYIIHSFPKLYHSKEWTHSVNIMQDYGAWALAGIALSPIPQQPAAAFSGLVKTPLVEVFSAILLGRALKYLALCWFASRARLLFEKSRLTHP